MSEYLGGARRIAITFQVAGQRARPLATVPNTGAMLRFIRRHADAVNVTLFATDGAAVNAEVGPVGAARDRAGNNVYYFADDIL